MLITRKNPLGGRPLAMGNFPLSEDKQGNFGLKLGYLESGEPILIAIRDAEIFASAWAIELKEFRKIYKKQRMPFKHWLAMVLLGKKKFRQIMNEEMEEGI